MNLFPYECHVCHTRFADPDSLGRCPSETCRSYSWGDKRKYYAALAEIKKTKDAQKLKVKKALERSKNQKKGK